jgi:hypothetical protein
LNKLGNGGPASPLPSFRETHSPSPRLNLPQHTNNNKSGEYLFQWYWKQQFGQNSELNSGIIGISLGA